MENVNGKINCVLSNNASTAYGRRKKWWLENNGPVPQGQIVDAGCGNPRCHMPEHAFLRDKIDIRVCWNLFGHVWQRFLDLPPGGNIGFAPPPGHSLERVATKLRGFFNSNKAFYMFRWSVKVRDDGILVVNKIGHYREAPRGQNYELLVESPKPKPRTCACGCGGTATNGAFVEGHLSVALKMKLCPGCGIAFAKSGRCCSRECATKYQLVRRVLGYTGKSKKRLCDY